MQWGSKFWGNQPHTCGFVQEVGNKSINPVFENHRTSFTDYWGSLLFFNPTWQLWDHGRSRLPGGFGVLPESDDLHPVSWQRRRVAHRKMEGRVIYPKTLSNMGKLPWKAEPRDQQKPGRWRTKPFFGMRDMSWDIKKIGYPFFTMLRNVATRLSSLFLEMTLTLAQWPGSMGLDHRLDGHLGSGWYPGHPVWCGRYPESKHGSGILHHWNRWCS